MKAAAIDMATLKDEAFGGEGSTVVVDRAWLQGIYRALNGDPFADISSGDAPAVRQARILGAIDGIISPGAAA